MKLPILTFAGAGTQYSPIMQLKRGSDVVFGYRHVGTITATMYLQVGISIAPYLTEPARVQWKTTTLTFDTLPAAGDCSDSENFYIGGYDCARLIIVAASGNGTIELSANVKD